MYGTIQVWFRDYYNSYSDVKKPEHLLRLMAAGIDDYWRVAIKDTHWKRETQYPFPTEAAARRFIAGNEKDNHPRLVFTLVNPSGAVIKHTP